MSKERATNVLLVVAQVLFVLAILTSWFALLIHLLGWVAGGTLCGIQVVTILWLIRAAYFPSPTRK